LIDENLGAVKVLKEAMGKISRGNEVFCSKENISKGK